MKPKVRATRALAAYTATRSLRLVSFVTLAILAGLIGLTWLLTSQVSSWWWVLLVPILLLGAILLLLRLIIRRIIRSIYPDPLSQPQRASLDRVTSKIARLAESRSTPLPILAIVTIKDIVVHRDVTTVRDLLDDGKSLSGDLRELESTFKDR